MDQALRSAWRFIVYKCAERRLKPETGVYGIKWGEYNKRSEPRQPGVNKQRVRAEAGRALRGEISVLARDERLSRLCCCCCGSG